MPAFPTHKPPTAVGLRLQVRSCQAWAARSLQELRCRSATPASHGLPTLRAFRLRPHANQATYNAQSLLSLSPKKKDFLNIILKKKLYICTLLFL